VKQHGLSRWVGGHDSWLSETNKEERSRERVYGKRPWAKCMQLLQDVMQCGRCVLMFIGKRPPCLPESQRARAGADEMSSDLVT
jgi:hypothetical protein